MSSADTLRQRKATVKNLGVERRRRDPAQSPNSARQEPEDDDESWFMCGVILLGLLAAAVLSNFILAASSGHLDNESRGGASNSNSQIQPIGFRVTATLAQVYLGESVRVSYPKKRQVLCDACNGVGGSGVATCNKCNGRGVEMRRVQFAPGFVQNIQQRCSRCGGDGRVIRNKCPKCQGERTLQSTDKLELTLPRGAPEGYELRLPGQGHQVPEEGSGDVVVQIVTTSKHSKFRRDGDDLHYTHTISLKESLLGFEASITHLDGHEVRISRADEVTAADLVLEFKREGMPIMGSSAYGKLFVSFDVKFPRKFTKADKAEISRLMADPT